MFQAFIDRFAANDDFSKYMDMDMDSKFDRCT